MLERNVIDINTGIEEYRKTKDSILLDVRTKQEYDESHIVDSINVALESKEEILKKFKDKNKHVFVYCRSGNRSNTATIYLKENGYKNVKNIGGIINADKKYLV